MGTPFSVIFIQFYIIAAFAHKINTLFEIFSRILRHDPGSESPIASPGTAMDFDVQWLQTSDKSCQEGNFCTKATAVVIFTAGEKMGFMSEPVEKHYVNPICIQLLSTPVEKSCGELCGECGKL